MKNLYLVLGWILSINGSDFVLAMVEQIYTLTADLTVPPSTTVQYSFFLLAFLLAALPLAFGIISRGEKSTAVLANVLIGVASIDLVAFIIKLTMQFLA